MAPYLSKLEMFISICGPHLGQMYSKNGLVDMGVGFLKLISGKGAWLWRADRETACKKSVAACFCLNGFYKLPQAHFLMWSMHLH